MACVACVNCIGILLFTSWARPIISNVSRKTNTRRRVEHQQHFAFDNKAQVAVMMSKITVMRLNGKENKNSASRHCNAVFIICLKCAQMMSAAVKRKSFCSLMERLLINMLHALQVWQAVSQSVMHSGNQPFNQSLRHALQLPTLTAAMLRKLRLFQKCFYFPNAAVVE